MDRRRKKKYRPRNPNHSRKLHNAVRLAKALHKHENLVQYRWLEVVKELTRLTPEQKQIIDSLANGKIDVIIGTHRLLSKDVKFKFYNAEIFIFN